MCVQFIELITYDVIILLWYTSIMGFPGNSDGKEPACNAGDLTSILRLGRYPVFFPGEFHGQRSLAGYSPMGLQRLGHD